MRLWLVVHQTSLCRHFVQNRERDSTSLFPPSTIYMNPSLSSSQTHHTSVAKLYLSRTIAHKTCDPYCIMAGHVTLSGEASHQCRHFVSELACCIDMSGHRKKYTTMHPYMYCFLFHWTNQMTALWSCDLPGSAHPPKGLCIIGCNY